MTVERSTEHIPLISDLIFTFSYLPTLKYIIRSIVRCVCVMCTCRLWTSTEPPPELFLPMFRTPFLRFRAAKRKTTAERQLYHSSVLKLS